MLKKTALVAALLGATVPAFAGSQLIDLSSGAASFDATSPVLGGGIDTLTFTNLAAGTYDFLLNISSQNITGLTAVLNGQSATVVSLGKFSFAGLESVSQSPFTLQISGVAGARAAYSGDLTVTLVTTPVPEPETYALFLGGIAALGLLAHRRKAADLA